MREALFNVLAHADLGPRPLEGACVADLFAGTGALGLEALSRGAARVIAVESDAGTIERLRAVAEGLDESERVTAMRADATRLPPARRVCDYVFLDPPYRSGLAEPALESLARQGWLAPGALLVVELAAREPFEPPTGFVPVDERRYGATRLVFMRWSEGDGSRA